MATSAKQSRAIFDTIATEAENRWGDRWVANLVRRYCEIESMETGEEVKPVNRRSSC